MLIWTARFSKKKAFLLFYDRDSGCHISGTDWDVFAAEEGTLYRGYGMDDIRLCIDDAGALDQCKNDSCSCRLLCSMGILYLVSCI